MADRLSRGFLAIMAGVNLTALWFLAVLLGVMTFAISIQIGVRFTASIPWMRVSAPWTEELARYCMIWMVFIGLGVGFRYRMLIAVTYVVEKLPGRWGRTLQYTAYAVSFAFLLLLVRLGMQAVEFGLIEMSPAMGISKSWVYWAMPAGCLLAMLNIVASIIESVAAGQDIRKASATLPMGRT